MKIEHFISEKCSNGVERKKLSEVGEIYSGLRGKSKDDFKDGNARYITYKNIYNNLSVELDRDDYVKVLDDEKQNYLELGDILVAGSSENMEDSGMVSVVTIKPTEKIYLNSFCFGFRPNEGLLFPGFSKYLFRCDDFRKKILKCSFGVTRYNLSKDKFLKIEIPIPPMEVQEEIANILDKFTELEARKSQYEYYRNNLLNFKGSSREVITLTMGDIYDFQYGTGNTIPESKGEYPVYGSNGIVGYHTEYNSEDAPVIGHIGAYAGIVNWGAGKHFVTYNGVICKHKNSLVNKRYAYYLLLIQDYIGGQKGAQPFVSYDLLKAPVVNIPPLEEQERIVNVLDKFSTLTNDITEGLPAEIKMRHQQYEYYRDKLLTFN